MPHAVNGDAVHLALGDVALDADHAVEDNAHVGQLAMLARLSRSRIGEDHRHLHQREAKRRGSPRSCSWERETALVDATCSSQGSSREHFGI